jgi:uncharacterized protein
MIRRILVENFFSFKEAAEIDFSVPEGAGGPDIYHANQDGTRLNSVLAIFGPNASGKTNLLKAIGFLQWFICYSATQKPGELILAAPFEFSRRADPAWKLELDFCCDGRLYRYSVRCTMKHVLHESLHVRKTRFNRVFERNWNPKTQQYEAKFHDFGDHAKLPLRDNASLISTAVLQENQIALELNKYFESFYGNIGSLGRNTRHDPDQRNLTAAARFFEENPKSLAAFNQALREANFGPAQIGVNQFTFMTEQGKEETRTVPIMQYEVEGKEYFLPLIRDSRGTQALFMLFRFILPVLQNGGVACIDELEASLHPHLIPYVVGLFYSRRTNPKQAQLVFTCHSDYLLTDLTKYQVVLVEKDESLVSHAWRLDRMQGVRASENIHAKYHAGAYGAIPDI